ncbi:hypothetical protein AB9E34_33670, partial [Rhizobium leguminosarum]
MKSLASEGMTMLCVTHEMGFARDVAYRVWFIDSGQILEMATPEEFFNNPSHPRAQHFQFIAVLICFWWLASMPEISEETLRP